MIGRGDLAYLPAEVCLLQFGKDGQVNKYFKTKKPRSVLVHTSEHHLNGMYKIVLNGEQWFVDRPNLYPIV